MGIGILILMPMEKFQLKATFLIMVE